MSDFRVTTTFKEVDDIYHGAEWRRDSDGSLLIIIGPEIESIFDKSFETVAVYAPGSWLFVENTDAVDQS